MIRHSLKLIWRRKGPNALLMVEIAISFLVLFALCLAALAAWSNSRHPLGFDAEGVWAVEITEGGAGLARASETSTGGPAPAPRTGDVSRHLLREARALPEVASAALIAEAPYEMSESQSTFTVHGREVSTETTVASDELAETLRLDLVAGRWFQPDDQGAHWRPVVLNRRFARELFGDADPIGRSLGDEGEERPQRVVGVVSSFRRKGELSRPANFMFLRQPSGDSATLPLRNLLVRVQPGVPRAWEQELVTRLEALAPGVSVRVRTLGELRRLSRQFTLVPLAVGLVLATFLLAMVVLGLLGVLWQDVTRRRREIGLRRALGADARAVHRQVMGELLVLACFGLVGGLLVVGQLPLLGVADLVGDGVFASAVLAAAFLLLGLAAIAGLHPSRMATRIQPAEALHHD